MNNCKKIFCITAVFSGLIATTWIVLQGLSLRFEVSLLDDHWIVGVISILVPLLITFSTLRSNLVRRFLCGHLGSQEVDPAAESRIEKYVLRRWKQQELDAENQSLPIPVTNRRGRRSDRPTEDKLRAIRKWDRISKGPDPIRLDEFLASEFGTSGGELNVSTGSFYYWRRKFGRQAGRGKDDTALS
ncbi:MAG: hypothetical protein AB1649_33045 [Chloroflexota bacterium]